MTATILENQVALITGSRRGIGRAIALELAKAGADVVLTDNVVNDGLIDEVRQEIEQKGRRAGVIPVDISRKVEVEAMAEKAIACYGKIDILVNCAGVWIPGESLVECSEENWNKVIDVNLKGTYLCCQAIGRHMISQQSGNIINLSSEVGITPGTGAGAYSISKAGIIMLTKQLALELARYHIRVNALAPGIVKTDFNAQFWRDPQVERRTASGVPLGRLAEPQDIAGATLFLLSPAASYITGEVLSVNGGWHPGG
jgi:3-oxoacyl-[acyl-carrier protein] reductase